MLYGIHIVISGVSLRHISPPGPWPTMARPVI